MEMEDLRETIKTFLILFSGQPDEQRLRVLTVPNKF